MARGGRNRRPIARRGLMLVLSSPSGAGKTTLSRMLLEADRRYRAVGVGDDAAAAAGRGRRTRLSLHRPPRASTRWCEAGELLEWAEVFGNCYGTPRAPGRGGAARRPRRAVRHRLAGHAAAAREGARDLVSVFILPPSIPELERRLRARAQDSDEVIRGRMAKAADEMSHWAEYDYVIVNRDIERAFAEVRAILAAERLKRERQIGLSAFVRGLQSEL